MPDTRNTPRKIRKNMDMDATALDAVKKVLGAKSETEAVHLAFEHVLASNRIVESLERAAKRGPYSSPFVREDEIPSSEHVRPRRRKVG